MRSPGGRVSSPTGLPQDGDAGSQCDLRILTPHRPLSKDLGGTRGRTAPKDPLASPCLRVGRVCPNQRRLRPPHTRTLTTRQGGGRCSPLPSGPSSHSPAENTPSCPPNGRPLSRSPLQALITVWPRPVWEGPSLRLGLPALGPLRLGAPSPRLLPVPLTNSGPSLHTQLFISEEGGASLFPGRWLVQKGVLFT